MLPPVEVTKQDPGDDEVQPELARLPAGRHGLPREFVIRNQRERLIAGVAKVVVEQGLAKASITSISAAAGVSRRTFYDNFETKEECFGAAIDVVARHLRAEVIEAVGTQTEWSDQVREGIRTVLRFFATSPDLARIAIVETLAAGPEFATRYRLNIEDFIPLLAEGRNHRDGQAPLPEDTEASLLGGMFMLIARYVAKDEIARLEELQPDLVEYILTPYLGGKAAARIAAEPAPSAGTSQT
jgi:AcrR family transcriptional regulator